MQDLFTQADLERIREATSKAEAGSAGEIVPYIVGRVDDHEVARWRGATLGALMAALLAGAFYMLNGYWGGLGMHWITLPAIVGAGLGFMLASYAPLARKLLTAEDIDRRVKRRAQAAFLEEQVFLTEQRTGILIFLAVFEHRAVILADEGIYRAIPPANWSAQVDELVAGIKAGQALESLCKTIDYCGELLREYDLRPRQDDENELHNDLRIGIE